ncbi:hypothetical protein C9426_24085 [Serratia sp. S1B]|nr:hypothetical protein C9426_24085 [Serratia sp. S1B]
MAIIRRKNILEVPLVTVSKSVVKPHDELCIRAERFLRSNGFSVAFHDRLRAWSNEGELPDALGFRNGVSCLIEVKCSRSDFLADKKKKFRVEPSIGMGDWRFLMCEPGIIAIEDLPDGWGLLYVEGRKVIKIYGWPSNGLWLTNKPFSSNKQAECDYLYSALRRVFEQGYADIIYG